MRSILGALAVCMVAGILQTVPARAQIQNPIQAAKDAYNKAKQPSQQQKQQGQTQNQQSAPTQTASATQPAAPDPQNGAASNDCCSADAQAKAAAAASVLDIVGIKLGMNPAQATAALKAYDPGMKFGVINTRLERPSNPNGFVRVPRFIFAMGPNTSPAAGPVEHITIQFSTPPNPPVVLEVERYVQFQNGQPVLASNMMANLRQKYGQENYGNPGGPEWIYDSNGKLLNRVPNVAALCQPTGNLSANIASTDLTHDASDGGVSLSNMVPDVPNLGISAENCVGYLYVRATGTGTTPNDKVTTLLVAIRSGALLYNSRRSTHDWLQSEADAVKKKQDSDAAGRSGPKL